MVTGVVMNLTGPMIDLLLSEHRRMLAERVRTAALVRAAAQGRDHPGGRRSTAHRPAAATPAGCLS